MNQLFRVGMGGGLLAFSGSASGQAKKGPDDEVKTPAAKEERKKDSIVGQGKKGPDGEFNTPAAKGERKKDSIKVGDVAPDFSLPLLKGKGEARLSEYREKKPVVLIFGSYT